MSLVHSGCLCERAGSDLRRVPHLVWSLGAGNDFPDGFLQGLPDLPAPQAVDEGIDQGCEDGVEEGEHFVQLPQRGCSGQHIDSKESAIEKSDNSEVRGAGGEGLLLAHAGWDP